MLDSRKEFYRSPFSKASDIEAGRGSLNDKKRGLFLLPGGGLGDN
jgi:hypothetical protein